MPSTYKLISLVGTSNDSFTDAVSRAIRDASKTVRGISWFEVDQLRGRVVNGEVDEYQVTLRAGFKVESTSATGRRPRKG
jgi:hypothetical protein